MPLGVVRTKSRSVWSDINPFLKQLGEAYKKSQQIKWDNEWQLAGIADIEKAIAAQEVPKLLEMQKQPKENLDMEGFEKFAKDSVNLLTMKEIEMSPEDFAQTGVKPSQGQMQTVPDKKEWNELYKLVSELPTGKIDWTDTRQIFKKRLESGRAIGTAGQQFLNMILGQSMPVNQRQKVQQDFEFTKDIKATLFSETFDEEAFYKEHPEMELKGATSTGHKTYGKKAEEGKGIDIDTFIKSIGADLEISNVNVSGTGIVNSFSLKPKDTTTDVDIKATIAKAEEWVRNHPDTEIDDINFKTGSVSIGRKSKTQTGGITKTIPTYGVIQNINEGLMNPDKDYDTELHNAQVKYNLEGVKLASKADKYKSTYDMFERVIIGEEYIDEKGVVQDEVAYADFYNDYEKYAKSYFDETGEILPKKYLSIEEAGKFEKIQWKGGVAKGDLRPVINTENTPWSWQSGVDPTEAVFNQMQRTGTKLEDVNLEDLAKVGVDVEKLKGLLGL